MGSAQNKITISENLTWRKVKDEAVILNIETSEYYTANQVGTFIWELLTKNNTEAKVAQELSKAYGISEQEALADTKGYIKQLSAMGLLE